MSLRSDHAGGSEFTAKRESSNSVEPVSNSLVRIFLMLENRLLREAMARILQKRDDLQVVGSCNRKECSTQTILESRCGVVILDFLDADWIRLTREAHNTRPLQLRFLLIGMGGEFEQLLAAVRAGVTGYLLMDASTEEIIAAVLSTSHGSANCSPSLCGCLFDYLSSTANCRPPQPVSARPLLTMRQQRLTALIAKGWTNKEIASHLNLSEYTIKNHVRRILKQVDAKSRSHAVEKILSHGYALTA